VRLAFKVPQTAAGIGLGWVDISGIFTCSENLKRKTMVDSLNFFQKIKLDISCLLCLCVRKPLNGLQTTQQTRQLARNFAQKPNKR
jgi:hypothetical protein